MQPGHALLLYEHVLVNVAFVISALFTPVVSLFWPWWESQWGQNIVSLELCIAGSLLSSWLFIDFGMDGAFFQWLTALFLTMIPFIITWRTVLIWRIQRQAMRDKRETAQARCQDAESGDCRP